MKSTAIACAIAAASLGFGSLSYAQDRGWGDRDGRGHDRNSSANHDSRGEQRGDSRRDWQAGQYQQRQFDRRQQPPQYSQRGQYDQRGQYSQYREQGQSGAHAPQYRRGDHLPYQFRQRQYYVNDWRAHSLYAPPYGYQWVQADDSGDFLLVALASGLIANLLLNQ